MRTKKNYVISNEDWKYNPSIRNTVYDNRFSLTIKPEYGLFRKFPMKMLQKDFDRLRKIIDHTNK